MFMVMLILDNPDYCQRILDAWDDAGVYGVTIFPSTGLGRVRRHKGLQEDTPLMPSLEAFFQLEESQHRTLMTIVPNQDIVDSIVKHTQKIIGDLNQPHNGILVVLPVAQAYGLQPRSSKK
jgi:nitrogen regulatory protein PII